MNGLDELISDGPAMGEPPEPRSDWEWRLQMSEFLGISTYSDVLIGLTIPGAPWSKSRPRFAKNGHTYTKAEDRDAEVRTGSHLRAVINRPLTGNVALGCVFFRPNRQRIDADNLIKHVCDAANGILWHDDSQCTAVMGVIEYDAENPRTLVVIGKHYSTLRRGTDASYPCPVCETPILMEGQTNYRKTCSRECAAKARGFNLLDTMVDCGICRRPFKRTTKTQRFCSRECGWASRRGLNRPAHMPSRCSVCGKQLSHTRGGKCRDCWRLGDRAVLTQSELDLGLAE